MAVATLSTRAPEEGTYIVTAVFSDDAGDSVVPNVLTWTLVDDCGVVINSRSGVSIGVASSVDIVLSGDDLAITNGVLPTVVRRLTIVGEYDSDAGSDLPLTAEVEFKIDNFAGL